MEGIQAGILLTREIAGRLEPGCFTIIDVGCSGGIDAEWREFGKALRAFGFDPNAHQLAELAALFAMSGLPDCAAELLLHFRPQLTPIPRFGQMSRGSCQASQSRWSTGTNLR